MSQFKKIAVIGLSTVLTTATLLPGTKTNAQILEPLSYDSLPTPYNFKEFDFEKYVAEMAKEIVEETGEEFSAEVVDGTKVLINTVDANNEPIQMIVDSITSEATIDGENVGPLVETEIFVDKDKLNATNPSSISISSNWTPVYQTTVTNTVKKVAGDLSKGAIYSVLILAAVATIFSGLGITVSVLFTKGKAFLASYGFSLATVLIGDIINGKWRYDLYRTQNPVPTGYGTTQYAYRYQGGKFSANFKIGKFSSPTWSVYGSVGSWWFSSKPF